VSKDVIVHLNFLSGTIIVNLHNILAQLESKLIALENAIIRGLDLEGLQPQLIAYHLHVPTNRPYVYKGGTN
jgi:hypothetical protein